MRLQAGLVTPTTPPALCHPMPCAGHTEEGGRRVPQVRHGLHAARAVPGGRQHYKSRKVTLKEEFDCFRCTVGPTRSPPRLRPARPEYANRVRTALTVAPTPLHPSLCQVRVGQIAAGNFGVPQVSPELPLHDWQPQSGGSGVASFLAPLQGHWPVFMRCAADPTVQHNPC